ncbi:ArsR/SmtB family transcription factor [Haliangium ochraceum]|uniref:Putative transcriptional regulator, ArsR family n=1 Tax=Haliangium ochraceum (strain DSM 14365 / JCM 11303 / SMP-2) TaxID=502025 RepID=D0LZ16_HALO1|nr:helix-turn-helix domain-containing protein [Haliangium ochraceum]ACY14486.1 putative transcriptional regulator, ArsR family [Haliangium ochraceum DSM 14365]
MDLDAVLRALADGTRRVIIDELAEREEQSLFEICVRLTEKHGIAISRQAVSKHLGILEAAGLIAVEWRGRTKLHSLEPAPLRALGRGWLANYVFEKESDK